MKKTAIWALALTLCIVLALFAGCAPGAPTQGTVIEKPADDFFDPADISSYTEGFFVPEPDAPADDGALEIICDGNWTVNESTWSLDTYEADFPKRITVTGLDDVAGIRLFPALGNYGWSLDLGDNAGKSCSIGYNVFTTIIGDITQHAVGDSFEWWQGEATLLNKDETSALIDWNGDRHTMLSFHDDNGQGTVTVELNDGFFDAPELAWSVCKALAANTAVEPAGDLTSDGNLITGYDNLKLVFYGGSAVIPITSCAAIDSGVEFTAADGTKYSLTYTEAGTLEEFLERYNSGERAKNIEKLFPIIAIKDGDGYLLQDRSIRYRLWVKSV